MGGSRSVPLKSYTRLQHSLHLSLLNWSWPILFQLDRPGKEAAIIPAMKVTKYSCRKCGTIFCNTSRHLAVILGKSTFSFALKNLNCIMFCNTSYSFIPLTHINFSEIFKIKIENPSWLIFVSMDQDGQPDLKEEPWFIRPTDTLPWTAVIKLCPEENQHFTRGVKVSASMR